MKKKLKDEKIVQRVGVVKDWRKEVVGNDEGSVI